MAVIIQSENEFFCNRGAELVHEFIGDAANDNVDTAAVESLLADRFQTDDVGHLIDLDGDIHFFVNRMPAA
ncbi:MAG: hypothetical protein ACFE0S_00350 [Rhodospirillales bacterium]